MGECVLENDMEPVPYDKMDSLRAQCDNCRRKRESWESILSSTYARVLDLHRRNWNGIWFRIVLHQLLLVSVTAGEFDVIVGNPRGPWSKRLQETVGTEWLLHAQINMIFLTYLITAENRLDTFLDITFHSL